MFFTHINNWIKRFIEWLREGDIFILCVLVLMNSFLYGFYVSNSETAIRVSGGVLQFLGMIFAIRGLLNIRVHFGKPRFSTIALDWLKRFPKWKNHKVVKVGSGSLLAVGGQARAEVWAPDDPNESIENRINSIVRNMDFVRTELRGNYSEIRDLKSRHKKLKEEQDQARMKLEKKINTDLEQLHTSDILVSLVGLVWVTIGLILSTLSKELSEFL